MGYAAIAAIDLRCLAVLPQFAPHCPTRHAHGRNTCRRQSERQQQRQRHTPMIPASLAMLAIAYVRRTPRSGAYPCRIASRALSAPPLARIATIGPDIGRFFDVAGELRQGLRGNATWPALRERTRAGSQPFAYPARHAYRYRSTISSGSIHCVRMHAWRSRSAKGIRVAHMETDRERQSKSH